MPPRRRLPPAQRRVDLLDVAATLFAERPYDEVSLDDVALRAEVSRALVYQHFPGKRDLFAAVYQRAAERLLDATVLDPNSPLAPQVAGGLDVHIDYFLANRQTVLAANRTLAGDPVIQAIISGELELLRDRVTAAAGLTGPARDLASGVLLSWLAFVRALSVEWLAGQHFSREQLRAGCLGALSGALTALGLELDQ